MNSKIAFEILTQNIKSDKDFYDSKNRFIKHSIYVGEAASMIAKKLNLDEDYAKTLGYLHDIGRLISHVNHPVIGYMYLNSLGYFQEARVALTHSFINNDITLTAGMGPQGEVYDFINDYLRENPPTIYDNIIQLCDLISLDTGFTTIEKRLLDVTKRKGVSENSLRHFIALENLKEMFEEKMEMSIYELLEISKSDIEESMEDRFALLELIKPVQDKKLMK